MKSIDSRLDISFFFNFFFFFFKLYKIVLVLLRSKSLQAINTGEGVEKREPSYAVGGNAN